MDPRETLWNLRFQELTEYERAHGRSNPPRRDGPSHELGRWVGRQREAKQQNILSAEREAKLNTIGFVWKFSCRTSWDDRFGQLEEYKKAKGNCNVSQKDKQYLELGNWVSSMRQAKKRSLLSDERQAKLDSIGFAWMIRKCRDSHCAQQLEWNVRFGELLAYKLTVGDCHVPQNFRPNLLLGRWVKTQRLANKCKTLTKERSEKLNSIGFEWRKYRPSGGKPTSTNQVLEEHKRTHHGLCDVPERCSGNNSPQVHKLATGDHFNNRQKEKKRQKEVLEKESVALLKTTEDENWDAYFRELLEYLQTYRDFNVPQGYPRNPLLARWVSEQRYHYDLKRRGQQTSLKPLREAKLDAIGFSWFVGGNTEEDYSTEDVVSCTVRAEEARSGNKVVRSGNFGVASPDRIRSF